MQMLGLSVRPWNEKIHPSKQFPVQLLFCILPRNVQRELLG